MTTTIEDIHRTRMMHPDTSDELAILAKDCKGLKKDERELIERAAEELRQCYRYMTTLQVDLHEANSHRVASGEKLGEVTRELEALRKQATVPVPSLKQMAAAAAPLTPSIAWYTLMSGSATVNSKPMGG